MIAMFRKAVAACGMALLAAALLSGFQGHALAAAEVETLSTGVGVSTRHAYEGYSLKLTFAERLGPLMAHVDVEIFDSAGKRVVRAGKVGPWFLVNLPPGRYVVKAVTADGRRTSARFELTGAGQQRVSLTW